MRRTAVLSDLHANLQATEACLAHADRAGAGRVVFLGDLVGYGADPVAVVRLVAERLARGAAVAVLGNHDAAALDPREAAGMNGSAAAAIAWTRRALDDASRALLAGLPMAHEEGDVLYIHADASAPARWRYVEGPEAARRSLAATGARVTLCGHVHVPALYGLTAAEKLAAFRPLDGAPVPLARPRRWLAVLGSVGQPRDGDPSACYAMLDEDGGGGAPTLTMHRVPYDAHAAAARVRAAGLPASLADRLLVGR